MRILKSWPDNCLLNVKSIIMNKWYFPGKFLNAAMSKASLENERCALHLKTKEGFELIGWDSTISPGVRGMSSKACPTLSLAVLPIS